MTHELQTTPVIGTDYGVFATHGSVSLVDCKGAHEIRVDLANEDEVWIATAANLPGVVAEGGSIKAAIDSLRDAIAGVLEGYEAAGSTPPWVPGPLPNFQGESVWITVDG